MLLLVECFDQCKKFKQESETMQQAQVGPNLQVIAAAVALLGIAEGRVRDRNAAEPTQFGLDLFTPFVASRAILPLGLAKALLSAGLKTIHALSVCEQDAEGGEGRLDCKNPHGDLAGRGFGEWWSIALFEYGNEKSMADALGRGRAGRNGQAQLPVLGFPELEHYVKNELKALSEKSQEELNDVAKEELEDQIADLKGTLESISALRGLRRATKALEGFGTSSPRLNLERTLILYAPSSGPSDGPDALWTNPAVRGANKVTSGGDPTDAMTAGMSGLQ